MNRLAGDNLSISVDKHDRSSWSEIIGQFDDTTIYQSWTYGDIMWGTERLSHLVLSSNGTPISGAQLRIVKLPMLPTGIAYVRGGPLWRLKDRPGDPYVFQRMLQALQHEYIHNRHLLLRILPFTTLETAGDMHAILEEENFVPSGSATAGRTIIMDLRQSLEELRKGMQRQWRNNLKKAEKNNLTVVQGNSPELYDMFAGLYQEMHARKNFVEYVDIEQYRLMQRNLADSSAMHIMICKQADRLCSALVCSAHGDTAINLLAATGTHDLEQRLNSSHLLFWRMMEWAKNRGCTWHDLGGINAVRNPGGYQFKKGLAGSKGIEVQPFPQFDISGNLSSSLFVRCGDYMRTHYRKTREARHHAP